MIDNDTHKLLKTLAEKYETTQFLDGDPSWFMHQVNGKLNQEAMAFLAKNPVDVNKVRRRNRQVGTFRKVA